MLLHAPGNTFVRVLEPGGTVCVQPSALVYADSSVRTHLHFELPKGAKEMYMRPGVSHLLQFVWLKIRGPGRVALQSVFARPEATGAAVNIGQSGHTKAAW